MNVKYKCPKCGAEVRVELILTYPPITCYRCSKCDYHYDKREKIVERLAPEGEE